MQNFKVDVLLVCETFLHENNTNLCHVNGYSFYYKNRVSGKGGGVAIYINDRIQSEEIELDLDINKEFVEGLFVKCKLKSNVIVVSELYRIPNKNESHYIDLVRKISEKCKTLKYDIILGHGPKH